MTPPSKTYQLVNTTNGTTVAQTTRLADNPWTSFKGLMGAAPLPAGRGPPHHPLLLHPHPLHALRH